MANVKSSIDAPGPVDPATGPRRLMRGPGWSNWIGLSELATPLVSVAMALGAARLFSTAAPVPRLLIVALAAHAIGTGLRRLNVGIVGALAGAGTGAVLILSWVYLGDSLTAGIPTGATWAEATREVHASFGSFRTAVAPVTPSVGFELVMAFGLYWLATFTDLATFRGRAPFQAVLPDIATFAAISIFARGLDATVAATLLTAAILIHLGCHRAATTADERWADDNPTRGTLSSVRSMLLIVGGAMLLGALATPLLPGAGTEPLVDLLKVGRGNGPVEVSNPLVGITNLLGNQSDAELFRVTSSSPHYWRITALENYDPDDGQWKTRRSYRDIDSGDELRPVGGSHNPRDQTVRVDATNVPGIWLPAPFSPRSVTSDRDLRYDPDTASIIISGAAQVPDISYEISAAIAQIDPADAPVGPTDRSAVAANYTTTAPLSPVAGQLLDDLEARQPEASQFELAQALQSTFRSEFRYSTDVDYSTAPVPIDAFLTARVGFCQQFSSAFALLARQLGIPSRIGVGFTWGEPAGTTDTGETTYIVRGRQAHAWPELYFDGLGWVPFEPTPGRGNPDSTAYGGVAAAQDGGPGAASAPGVTTTTVATTSPGATPGGGATTLTPTTTIPRSSTEPAVTDPRRVDAPPTDDTPWWLRSLIIAGILAVVAAAVIAIWVTAVAARAAQRRSAATTSGARVALAWETAVGWLADAGVHRRAWETPDEFSTRVDVESALGPNQVSALRQLAILETTRVHSPIELTDEQRAAAEDASTAIGATVNASLSRWSRYLRQLGIRRTEQ